MGVFTWHNGEVPKSLKVTQVYGLVFSQDGRLLLRVEEKDGTKIYSLAGGKPEPFENTYEETLRREFEEEVNTTLKSDVFVVGYQEVNEGNGKEPYAQLRMTALIDEVGKKQPDPDNGKTYDRVLAPAEKAIDLLNWGDVGKKQIEEATIIAKEKFEFKKLSQEIDFI